MNEHTNTRSKREERLRTSLPPGSPQPRHKPHAQAPRRLGTVGDQLLRLASRLTDRDRAILRLIHQHRVFTTHQLASIFFDSVDRAEHRLRELAQEHALDRFRPRLGLGEGSAPYHYVLGPAGAAVVAAEHGIELRHLDPPYRRDQPLQIAHSQRLGHLVGVNGFFAALAAYARQHAPKDAQIGPWGAQCAWDVAEDTSGSDAAQDRPPITQGAALVAWWPERKCHDRWGHLVRPDGYGRWHQHGREIDFFVEYDRATEPLDRLAGKLDDYHELATASQIATPVLFWLPISAREAAARQALQAGARWHEFRFLVATGCAALGRGPAENAWLPLGQTHPRRRLIELEDAIG